MRNRTITFGLTLLSALGRVVPHAPNVTPLGGSCLFAGSRIAGFWAYLLPLVVMLATDPFLGGYTRATPVIYAAFLINVWIGRRMLRNVTALRVGSAAFLCSLQFFALTNFAVWAGSHIYPANLSGLLLCYTEAIPFWGRTLAGDLACSGALFGLYALLNRRFTAASAQPAAA